MFILAILHGILETTTALNTDPSAGFGGSLSGGGGGGPHFRKANIGRLETETRAENLSGFPLYSSVPLWQQGFRSIPPWGWNSIKGCMLHDAMIEEFSPTSFKDCLGWQECIRRVVKPVFANFEQALLEALLGTIYPPFCLTQPMLSKVCICFSLLS